VPSASGVKYDLQRAWRVFAREQFYRPRSVAFLQSKHGPSLWSVGDLAVLACIQPCVRTLRCMQPPMHISSRIQPSTDTVNTYIRPRAAGLPALSPSSRAQPLKRPLTTSLLLLWPTISPPRIPHHPQHKHVKRLPSGMATRSVLGAVHAARHRRYAFLGKHSPACVQLSRMIRRVLALRGQGGCV
jgi:hypothetical protein